MVLRKAPNSTPDKKDTPSSDACAIKGACSTTADEEERVSSFNDLGHACLKETYLPTVNSGSLSTWAVGQLNGEIRLIGKTNAHIAATKASNSLLKVGKIAFFKRFVNPTHTHVDPKTGNVIEASLKIRRLCPDAIPSHFPNLPKCFSLSKPCSPNSKKTRTEQGFITRAIKESCDTKRMYVKSKTFRSLKELFGFF
ncbi:hypothetical protein AVEN_263630-1 [Araneus ventricosus]|uniref:Uncharacterized protein n=1 Tax=Araneus ventricosus TaxID=182803 RepID=A0A4Y2ATS2_ARAVE|nr:hypothetical protein AVEN_263630-1 [Araneus ventricosus]